MMRSTVVHLTRKLTIDIGESISHSTINTQADKFAAPPTINEKEVYATFLSTRIGSNADAGEFEQDWYYNSTRVLIHRLLRTPETRSRRNVVVSPLMAKVIQGRSDGECRTMETRPTKSRRCDCQTCSDLTSAEFTISGSHVIPPLPKLMKLG
jgi:hypothetical protein